MELAIISAFRAHCSLDFFKGALLKDSEGILVQPGENSYIGRQIRLTGAEEIDALEPVLTMHINEAIEVERVGLKVDTSGRPDLDAAVLPLGVHRFGHG